MEPLLPPTDERNSVDPLLTTEAATLPVGMDEVLPADVLEPLPSTPGPRRFRPWFAVAGVVCFLAALLPLALSLHRASSAARQFWDPLFARGNSVLIYLPSPVSYALSADVFNGAHPPAADGRNLELGINTVPVALPGEKIVKGSQITPLVDFYVNKDDAFAVSELSRFFSRLGKDDQVRIGQDLTFPELRGTPAVLIGAYNPLAPVGLHSAAYEALGTHLALVLFDRFPPGFRGAAVLVNNVEASRRGTQCLLDAGHTRIAIIAGKRGILTAEERVQGVRDTLERAGLVLPPEYVRNGDFNMQGGYTAATELLHLPIPPTAIFAHNYEMTLGLMRALKENGVACPGQVSVLGFDDFVVGADGFSWATMFAPEISCIAQPSYELGREAAAALIRKINHRSEDSEAAQDAVVRLGAELRLRQSIAAPQPLAH